MNPALQARSRNRHRPRVCLDCRAPMACATDRCWRCGAAWTEEPSHAPAERTLRERTDHVLETRARRHVDSARRNRRAARGEA